jgi:hypothetical protein
MKMTPFFPPFQLNASWALEPSSLFPHSLHVGIRGAKMKENGKNEGSLLISRAADKRITGR